MRTLLCLLAVAVVAQASSSFAQPRYRGYGRYPGYGHGGGYRHASTAAEGYQRGMADVIRSRGAYNLMTSQAMSNVEDARKKHIQNRLYGTQTYFEMRRLNKEARAAEAGPRPTQQDLIRYSQLRSPNRLSKTDVDPLTGGIAWPPLLQEAIFKPEREVLDELYRERAERGSLTASEVMKADKLVKDMDAKLQANVGRVSSLLYSPAKSFLRSLSLETYLAPQ